jgi:hypothetical protein
MCGGLRLGFIIPIELNAISMSAVLDYRTTCCIITLITREGINMGRSKLDAHADDICRRYRNGQTAASIAREYDATTTTITTFLKKVGLREAIPRGFVPEQVNARRELAVKMFIGGKSPGEIIKETGISKSILYPALQIAGAELRGHSSDPLTEEYKIRVANGRQCAGSMNRTERAVFDMLTSAGINAIPQFAIGINSVDFAIYEDSIAIEICCRGTYSLYNRTGKLDERIKNLGGLGWHVYVLSNFEHENIVSDGIKDMLAWIQFIKSSPSMLREYRVFRGSSELLSCGKIDSD